MNERWVCIMKLAGHTGPTGVGVDAGVSGFIQDDDMTCTEYSLESWWFGIAG